MHALICCSASAVPMGTGLAGSFTRGHERDSDGISTAPGLDLRSNPLRVKLGVGVEAVFRTASFCRLLFLQAHERPRRT